MREDQFQLVFMVSSGKLRVSFLLNFFITISLTDLLSHYKGKMGNEMCCETNLLETPEIKAKQQQFHPIDWPQDDQFITQWIENNQHEEILSRKPKKHYLEEKYYCGDWMNGLPQGKGIMYQPKKYLYFGNFFNGCFYGEGQIKFLNNNGIWSIYNGFIVNGHAEGQGIYDHLKYQFRFEGNWYHSMPTSGTINFFSDPNVSDLKIINVEQRTVLINYRDLRVYEGQINIEKFLPDGMGKVTFPQKNSKDYYDGQWKQGKMHGKGIHKWKDNSAYKGQYEDGKKQGFGIFIYASGNSYEGYWNDGKQNGLGISYDKKGVQVKRGIWKNGQFVYQIDAEEWNQQNQQYKAGLVKEQEDRKILEEEGDDPKKITNNQDQN